jgi:hypothetical protein
LSARRVLPLFCLVLALGGVSSAGATTPGQNGRIAFAASATSELYSVNADGSALRRLTWTTQAEQAPAWSPDGTRIAYESLLDGQHIWVMNADGSSQTRLTSGGYAANDADPAWSPDGTQIAFGSTRSGNWNLWVMNNDGSGMRQVSTAFGDDPAWSPDGRRLAYLRVDGIGVVGMDGSDPHTVSAAGGSASGPSWSPDGTQIVFSRNNAAGYPGELFVANADGSGEHQLTGDGASNARPSWSPDGTRITFERTSTPPFGWNLWAIGVDGSGLRQVTSSGNAIGPDWGSSQVVPEPSPPDAPAIQIYSPDPHALYLPTSQIHAFYQCSSFVSFVVSCDGDVPVGALMDLTQAGSRTFTVRAVDADGRTATASVTFQVLDIVPPKIELRTPADGATYELGSAATVDYACTDPNGSGISYCAGDRPNGFPVDTSQPGTHTFTVYALDNVHNFTQATATYTVVDHRPPTIQITSPSNGSTYTLGDMVLAGYSCHSASDTHIATCAGPVANGNAIDTSSVGAKTFSVNASDDYGKTASMASTYAVLYAFTGFDSPVSAGGSIDTAKAGDSVPLKFSLRGNQGLGVVMRTTWQAVSCVDWSALGAAATAQAKLSYNAANDRYLDVVGTDSSWKGLCRTVDVELADGTHHAVHVRFTR